jgi:cation/acetate symporter
VAHRPPPSNPSPDATAASFQGRLHAIYGGYLLSFIAFVLVLAVLEQRGLSRHWIGFIFLISTIVVYACIGIIGRTSDAAEYYVAGRRVPAFYNGMATAGDWMSTASFMGMAGTLYLSGYDGLAFVMGWTGGFCLVALLLAPYLRKFGRFTIPDFLGERYGPAVRLVGIVAAVGCSFIYVVAQLYGVGLIASRLTGVTFEIGIFLGLGGVLVCSFLGGMRAVTWTQVAQYIVLIIAFLVPVVWLSIKQVGTPIPQLAYGAQLAKLGALEQQLKADPKELEVIEVFRARADEAAAKLKDVPAAMRAERAAAEQTLANLLASKAPMAEVRAARRVLFSLPQTEAEAQARYAAALAANEARARPLGGMPEHARPFAGDPDGDASQRRAYTESRLNFLALVFCLMVGTAGLPHILVRCYTTPSVRAARQSVAWSLLFIALLYFTAPALAVLVKYEVFSALVGTPFDTLPAWIANWNKVDPGLLSVSDVNRDGILQLGEMKIGGDIIVLATPEIGGMPYVISALVAAGGLAAALSTADGLLLTIANALSHDLHNKLLVRQVPTSQRVMASKMLLLAAALAAAYVASQKPADILFMVTAAFSLAGAAFFPALVLGIFWKRTTATGALCGMLAGVALTAYYMIANQPGWGAGPASLWFGIQPIVAGVFGVPAGFAVMVVVSLLGRAPGSAVARLVDELRSPDASGL